MLEAIPQDIQVREQCQVWSMTGHQETNTWKVIQDAWCWRVCYFITFSGDPKVLHGLSACTAELLWTASPYSCPHPCHQSPLVSSISFPFPCLIFICSRLIMVPNSSPFLYLGLFPCNFSILPTKCRVCDLLPSQILANLIQIVA